MKKLKFMLLALCALMFCLFTNSCSEEDDSVIGQEYFMVLDKVGTNLVDQQGNSLADTILDDFKFSNNEHYISMGTASSIPTEIFEQSCKNVEESIKAAWNGNLPENGYIEYCFSMREGSRSGTKVASKTIIIQ